jgi:threonine aldolase
VAALERRTAEVLGKEAAVFMPSGTMTNQVAIRAHTEPGDEILLEAEAHVYFYEVGAPAALSGVMCRLIQGTRGIFTAADVKAALRPRNVHFPVTKLVCIENTHNRGGGSVWPIERIAEVTAATRDAGLKCHLDGARLWNATAATRIPENEYARHFDTLSVCFSKGLGAPVGSALAGPKEFIDRARRFRKQFGGGMRQAGIIAAGALYALENHRQRLADDHANAKALATGIAQTPGMEIVDGMPETNIINLRVKVMSADEFARRIREAGVWMLTRGPDTLRAVTNLDVSAAQIAEALAILRKVATQ